MARELVDGLRAALQRQRRRPRRGPGGGVGERHLVVEGVGAGQGEPLDEMEALGGSAVVAVLREVAGLDDQGVAVPAAARVAVPLADGVGEMGAPVEGDDPRVVERLADERHGVGRLDELVERVGARPEVAAEARHAGRHAAVDVVEVLGAGLELPSRIHRRLPRPRLRGEGGDAAVGRIDDEGRPVGDPHVDHADRAAGGPRLVGLDVVQGGEERALRDCERAPAVPEDALHAGAEGGDLLVGQVRPVPEHLGPLQRGGGVAEPDALQIGAAVGQPRRGPVLADGLRAGGTGGQGQRDEGGRRHGPGKMATAHGCSSCLPGPGPGPPQRGGAGAVAAGAAGGRGA